MSTLGMKLGGRHNVKAEQYFDPNYTSPKCSKGNHSNCYTLKCGCICHKN